MPGLAGADADKVIDLRLLLHPVDEIARTDNVPPVNEVPETNTIELPVAFPEMLVPEGIVH